MSGPILDCRELAKHYGPVVALRNLTLRLQPGIAGILGPNGAGKTTFLKMILGLLRPTSGNIEVLGLSPQSEGRRLRTQIGYVPEEDAYWEGLTAVGSVVYAGRLCRMSAKESLRKAHEALDWAGFSDERYRLAETLSMGMRQRLRFAMAMVHSPRLLILDEPTRHLDPTGRAQILSKLKELGRQGISILISTHQLDEVEKLCDTVALISSGDLVLHSPVESLLKNLDEYELQPTDPSDRLQRLFSTLGVEPVWEGGRARFKADAERIDRLMQELRISGASLRLLRPVPVTLDEILPRAMGSR